MEYIPILSEVGEFHGRDALHLDKVQRTASEVSLIGDVNASLVSKSYGKEWIPYCFNFKGVVKIKETELDEWESINHLNSHESSTFYEIVDPGPKATNFKNLVIQTYDIVFEICCESYDLQFN